MFGKVPEHGRATTCPIVIGCDNKAALLLCRDCKEGQLSKHIDVVHHFARDRVMTGELEFAYCKSEDNVSNCPQKLFRGLCLTRA
jgi:hypothetical protein